MVVGSPILLITFALTFSPNLATEGKLKLISNKIDGIPNHMKIWISSCFSNFCIQMEWDAHRLLKWQTGSIFIIIAGKTLSIMISRKIMKPMNLSKMEIQPVWCITRLVPTTVYPRSAGVVPVWLNKIWTNIRPFHMHFSVLHSHFVFQQFAGFWLNQNMLKDKLLIWWVG